MKYVIFENGIGAKMPVLFPHYLIHSDIKVGPGWTPVSAGQVRIERTLTQEEELLLVAALVGGENMETVSYYLRGSVVCEGGSESLHLQSSPEDSLLCALVLNEMDAALCLASGLALPERPTCQFASK